MFYNMFCRLDAAGVKDKFVEIFCKNKIYRENVVINKNHLLMKSLIF